MPCPTYKYNVQSFSYISLGLVILIILLKISLLILSLIIQVMIPRTIQFSLIFYLCFHRTVRTCWRLSLMRFQISFFMSIVLIRLDYNYQLAKSLSFTLLDLLEVLLVFIFVYHIFLVIAHASSSS